MIGTTRRGRDHASLSAKHSPAMKRNRRENVVPPGPLGGVGLRGHGRSLTVSFCLLYWIGLNLMLPQGGSGNCNRGILTASPLIIKLPPRHGFGRKLHRISRSRLAVMFEAVISRLWS